MKKILLLTIMAILALTASAYNFMVNGLAYNYLNGKSGSKVEVTCSNSNDDYANNYSGLTTANIPSSVTYSGKTYSVTSISNYAFDRCSGLTSVTIPNSVTSIGDWAFFGCSGLTSVTIGNSVTSIGKGAFDGCRGLTSVTIPNSVTSIGDLAFDVCSGLTSVTIGNSVTSIGSSAFKECRGLTSVTIPNSVTSIGSEAFYGCSLIKSIKVESGNTKYDSRNNCNAIIETATNTLIAGCKNTSIPNSVTSIGIFAFGGCSGLTSVTIPNSVTSISSVAFRYCSGLTSVTIPNSVTSIGWGAFYGTPWFNNQPDGLVYAGLVAYKYKGTMPANTSITLRDGTKGIAGDAFLGCSGLTSVTIPNSVTSIGSEAFESCSGLTEIRSKIVNVSDVSMGNYVFYDVPKSSCTLKVLIGTATAYRSANQWKDFRNINEVILMPNSTVGDLNRDNAVNGEDINIMVNYLLHKSVYIDDDGVADIDCDGKPTGFDLNRIVRIILGE